MKRIIASSLFLVLAAALSWGISPYLKISSHTGPMNEAVGTIESRLQEQGYEILGKYQPGNNPDLFVLVFSSDALIALSQQSGDRGMLAAAMKVGFQRVDGKISVSMVNPEYLFYAYFQDKMNESSFKAKALELSSKTKDALLDPGTQAQAFGGDLDADKLMHYKYMAGMPTFSKSVSLGEFDDFRQALAAVRNGLSGNGNTLEVYEIVDMDKETAVFGIGLADKEKGEAHFLPIIGESHVAAMPCELIIQGNEASMLHGRFRFALHWPELTMKTFTKIMSSPGDVEDAMKGLFETD